MGLLVAAIIALFFQWNNVMSGKMTFP